MAGWRSIVAGAGVAFLVAPAACGSGGPKQDEPQAGGSGDAAAGDDASAVADVVADAGSPVRDAAAAADGASELDGGDATGDAGDAAADEGGNDAADAADDGTLPDTGVAADAAVDVGDPDVPLRELRGVTRIAAGGATTCVVLADSTVDCWGDNSAGELGQGTLAPAEPDGVAFASPVLGLSGVTSVSVPPGAAFACALLSDGSVSCWGANGLGQLGNGHPVPNPPYAVTTPTQVLGLAGKVTAISTGGQHACAVLADETLACWGSGPIGLPSTSEADVATAVPKVSGVKAVAAGTGHTCILLKNGTMACAGDNSTGAFGDGTTNSSMTFVPTQGITSATAVVAGEGHTCALLADATVECWGNLVGDGVAFASNVPRPVPLPAPVVSLRNGHDHVCALLNDDEIECWGTNLLPTEGWSLHASLFLYTTAAKPLDISSGDNFDCALEVGGGVECWGANDDGQLGDGRLDPSTAPAKVLAR